MTVAPARDIDSRGGIAETAAAGNGKSIFQNGFILIREFVFKRKLSFAGDVGSKVKFSIFQSGGAGGDQRHLSEFQSHSATDTGAGRFETAHAAAPVLTVGRIPGAAAVAVGNRDDDFVFSILKQAGQIVSVPGGVSAVVPGTCTVAENLTAPDRRSDGEKSTTISDIGDGEFFTVVSAADDKRF